VLSVLVRPVRLWHSVPEWREKGLVCLFVMCLRCGPRARYRSASVHHSGYSVQAYWTNQPSAFEQTQHVTPGDEAPVQRLTAAYTACSRHVSRSRDRGCARVRVRWTSHVGVATVTIPASPHGLTRKSVGSSGLSVLGVSASAPMTVLAGGVIATFATAGVLGVPLAFILLTIPLLLVSVGLVAMSRDMEHAGAFYAFLAGARPHVRTRWSGRRIGRI
jgi:hypothetical protein